MLFLNTSLSLTSFKLSRLPVIIDDFILRDSNGKVIYDTNGNCFTIGEVPSNVLLDEYGEVILDANGDYFTIA